MKLFKTTTLIAALATSFGAHAELQSLDDAAMTDITGQEGITIVMKAEIKNLDVAYSDDLDAAARADATGATGSATGGVLGLDGISTNALTITQTVDIVSADKTGGAIAAGDLATANDRILAMSIKGLKGTITVGALRVGNSIQTAIGDGTAPSDAAFHTNRATSLGSLTLGNLTTGGDGIVQYIYAH